ncbi:ATP synthase F1 subunit epsilon [Candidatus Woesebacteria bacterium]|nr:ATP synthase F1 subunit epsilon [Candidatus Woesebacteria bacterium]
MFLKVITPRKIVIEKEIDSVILPTVNGEITVLPRHTHLISLLKEGVITMKKDKQEEYLAVGGGYAETDGRHIQIMVSRAYNQDEIDEEITKKAIQDAHQILEKTKDKHERTEAASLLNRSVIDMKLLQKYRRRRPSSAPS